MQHPGAALLRLSADASAPTYRQGTRICGHVRFTTCSGAKELRGCGKFFHPVTPRSGTRSPQTRERAKRSMKKRSVDFQNCPRWCAFHQRSFPLLHSSLLFIFNNLLQHVCLATVSTCSFRLATAHYWAEHPWRRTNFISLFESGDAMSVHIDILGERCDTGTERHENSLGLAAFLVHGLKPAVLPMWQPR